MSLFTILFAANLSVALIDFAWICVMIYAVWRNRIR